MEKKRKIPYGVINWATLVRECLFVDNTSYIRKLEDVATPVFLRPKRFGKSIVCSMLAHYYDVDLRDRFDELFGMTDIGRNPTPLRNSFLVLTFDFSTVQVGTLAEIERNFWENVKRSVNSLIVREKHLADWSGVFKAQNPADLIDAVRSVIRENHLPPLYVIIDEYDNFTNELVVSNRDMEYNAICGHDSKGDVARESFFKAFFKSFKAGLADGTVARTYFTGVLPITLDDLSSGFNVGTVVSLDADKIGLVGFTQSQVDTYVDDIFAEHGLDPLLKPVVLTDLKNFYDGYRFVPEAEPLYNATICNWYLRCLLVERKIPTPNGHRRECAHGHRLVPPSCANPGERALQGARVRRAGRWRAGGHRSPFREVRTREVLLRGVLPVRALLPRAPDVREHFPSQHTQLDDQEHVRRLLRRAFGVPERG